MSLHMEFVLRACGELSRAQIALKGLLSCVDSYVFLKIPILVEGLLTIRTLEGFRPIVPSHVRYKAGSVFELLPTHSSQKNLDSSAWTVLCEDKLL